MNGTSTLTISIHILLVAVPLWDSLGQYKMLKIKQ